MIWKRGRIWQIRIKWKGSSIRRSTGTGNKDLARKIESEVRDELVKETWFKRNAADTTIFIDVWQKYMREEMRYKAPGTFNRAHQAAINFLPIIGNLTLSEISPSVLSGYKAKRFEDGVKPSTVVKELQHIRRVFSLCKREWELIKQSPFEFFTMPSVKDQRVRFFEPGQFEKLLVVCPSWLKPITILARYTGMRRSNILNLTWSQVDFQNRVINLENTKNGQRLTIPLTETSFNLLFEVKNAKITHLNCPFVFHQDGKTLNPYRVSIAFRRACKRAGIENFRLHDLRHDFASNLVQKGNDLYVVQSLLGHKDGRMTQRYAHLKIENLRKAVETLEGHKKGHSLNEKEAVCAAKP